MNNTEESLRGSITNNPGENSITIHYIDGTDVKVFYNPVVKVVDRFTREELKQIADNKKNTSLFIYISDKEKEVSIPELRKLVLRHELSEKDINNNANAYIHNEMILRILAAALSKNDALCVEPPVRVKASNTKRRFIPRSTDKAMILDKHTVLTELDVDRDHASDDMQTFKTVVF